MDLMPSKKVNITKTNIEFIDQRVIFKKSHSGVVIN